MKKIILVIAMLVAISSAALAQMPDHGYGEYSIYTNAMDGSNIPGFTPGKLYGFFFVVIFKDGEAITYANANSGKWSYDIAQLRGTFFYFDAKNFQRWARGETTPKFNSGYRVWKYSSSLSNYEYEVYTLNESSSRYVMYVSTDGKHAKIEPRKWFNRSQDHPNPDFYLIEDESEYYPSSSGSSVQDKLKQGGSDGKIYE